MKECSLMRKELFTNIILLNLRYSTDKQKTKEKFNTEPEYTFYAVLNRLTLGSPLLLFSQLHLLGSLEHQESSATVSKAPGDNKDTTIQLKIPLSKHKYMVKAKHVRHDEDLPFLQNLF